MSNLGSEFHTSVCGGGVFFFASTSWPLQNTRSPSTTRAKRHRLSFDIQPPNLRQTEDDPETTMRIDCLPISARRAETDLLGGRNRRFVQSIAKPLQYTKHANLSCGGELHFEFHIAFDLLLASFSGVYRRGLAQQGNGRVLSGARGRLTLRCLRSRRRIGRTEIGRLHLLLAGRSHAALSGSGDTVSESCAGDRSLRAGSAACAVTGTRPAWQVKGTELCDRRSLGGRVIRIRRNSVRIAKASSLYLMHRLVQSDGRRTSKVRGDDAPGRFRQRNRRRSGLRDFYWFRRRLDHWLRLRQSYF